MSNISTHKIHLKIQKSPSHG